MSAGEASDVEVECFGDLLQIQHVRVKINHIFVHFKHSILNFKERGCVTFNHYFSILLLVTKILSPFGGAVN